MQSNDDGAFNCLQWLVKADDETVCMGTDVLPAIFYRSFCMAPGVLTSESSFEDGNEHYGEAFEGHADLEFVGMINFQGIEPTLSV